jgi:hypothetical protein
MDETSSSHSHVSSQHASHHQQIMLTGRSTTRTPASESLMEPETLDILEDEGLLFTDIPVMSNEGMYSPGKEGDDFPLSRNNELQEGEQEEMVLDKGQEYRMVSIMRVKRANVVTSPYDIEGHALS